MRSVCPKVNIYCGPILNGNIKQCVTSKDLDEAMLETRQFSLDRPVEDDHAWSPVLQHYDTIPRWPHILPPGREVSLSTLLHTKDSAPGPDGIPYAAWRVLPEVTLQAMSSYFYDIIEEAALPPMQVGVWIPKAKMGPKADNFRPLGMPNTLDRLVDGTVAAHLMHHTAHLLHPSQTVMSYFKEPQRAVSRIQRIIDSAHPACALLADLSKAFERINPHWILYLQRIRGAPRWVIAYTKFVLFRRRVTHKVQGRLLPSRVIHQGVDMGRSFSVYLFCFAMDPLFHYLNRIPGVLSAQAYVDDTTIAGSAEGPMWIYEVANTYKRVATAGFHIDGHTCFRSCINNLSRQKSCDSTGRQYTLPRSTAPCRKRLLTTCKREDAPESCGSLLPPLIGHKLGKDSKIAMYASTSPIHKLLMFGEVSTCTTPLPYWLAAVHAKANHVLSLIRP